MAAGQDKIQESAKVMDGGSSREHRESGEVVYHGGSLAVARDHFPGAPEPWIDLSTGINPHPYPIGDIPLERWTRLPESVEIARLETCAASAYGCPDPGFVAAAPGTQALIQLIPQILKARHVGIVGFTYQEHATVWRAAGAEVATFEGFDDPGLDGSDVVVLVNPNNPDGRFVPPDGIRRAAARLATRGGALIVDEAFIDVLRLGASVVGDLPEGTLVMRSFGKTYGLAGLRLGFALARPPITDRIRAALGPWAVSGPAVEIGIRALADRAWLDLAIRRLEADAIRLDGLMTAAGFAALGGTALFRLYDHPRSDNWFERFGRAGILVRPFPDRPTWLRLGLPASEEAWARLARVFQ